MIPLLEKKKLKFLVKICPDFPIELGYVGERHFKLSGILSEKLDWTWTLMKRTVYTHSYLAFSQTAQYRHDIVYSY